MRRLEQQLSLDAIVTLAERESGAFGMIDDGLHGRVAALVGWINARGPYTPGEVGGMRRQIQRLLVNRLHLKLDRQRFPGIPEEKIDRPIIIIGFARSGTTLLHSLLAEDPEMLTPRVWQTRMISPPPGAGPIPQGRIDFAQRWVDDWIDMCPAQLPMHPYADEGAHMVVEDEEIFTLDFRNAYPSLLYKVPTLDVMVVLEGALDAFRFHREVLQHLQWNTGRRRWVTKTGSAQNNLEALFEVYPDALCVWAHRPLSEIYASNVAIRSATYDAINGGSIDWTDQARERAEQMKAGIDRLMANAMIDDPRIMHLPFHELSADPVAAVRKVYDRSGIAVSPEFEARMRAWLGDPRNDVSRYGRYPYSYAPFGFDKAWVQQLFADYSSRFGLRDEA